MLVGSHEPCFKDIGFDLVMTPSRCIESLEVLLQLALLITFLGVAVVII